MKITIAVYVHLAPGK